MSDDRTDYVRGPGLNSDLKQRRARDLYDVTGYPACPWPNNCRCTHDNGCTAGWLEDEEGNAKPCPRCRPRQAAVLADPMLTRGQAMWKLRNPNSTDGGDR